MGDLESAKSDYSRAIDVKSDFTDALFNRGFTRSILGEYAASLPDIDEAIRQNPGDATLYNLRGNVNTLFGKYWDALEDFDRAIDIDPRYSEAVYNRGITRILSYQSIDGCRDLEESLRMGYLPAREKLDFFCNKIK